VLRVVADDVKRFAGGVDAADDVAVLAIRSR
jgi:hypothetical protein